MRLVVQSGNQQGQVFELTKDFMTLGRDLRCDVKLADAAASRNHCQLRHDPSGWVLQDLGSMNGTLLNGQRINAPSLLLPGDLIAIGKTMLRVEDSPAVVVPVLPPALMPAPPAESSTALMWIILGSILIVLLLIGIVGAAVVLMQPPPQPSATPLPSLTPIATTTLPSVAPTVTPRPITPVPPTPAGRTLVAPTAMPNIEQTRTLTPTPTRTVTLTPTATPTQFFPEPYVLHPQDKAKFSIDDSIILQWTPVDRLRALDDYMVQVSTRGEFTDDLICALRTNKQTQITLSSNACAGRLVFNSIYYWRIQVVAPGGDGRYVLISPVGTVRQFGWQP